VRDTLCVKVNVTVTRMIKKS